MDRSGCLAEGRGFGNLETATNRCLISTETREGRINSVFHINEIRSKDLCAKRPKRQFIFNHNRLSGPKSSSMLLKATTSQY
jgi:hypothetical protein